MKRQITDKREDYKKKIEKLGFVFHDNYWNEGTYYEITNQEMQLIEEATKECYKVACDTFDIMASEYKRGNTYIFNEFGFPDSVIARIVDSWYNDDLSLYGRFDFCLKDGRLKLYEFNADTPTSLLESSLIQWFWKEDVFPEYDQYNSIHENLIQSWKDISSEYNVKSLSVVSVQDNEEDLSTSGYIASCAVDANLNVHQFDIEQLRFDDFGHMYNPDETPVEMLFKLYPTEWFFEENKDELLKCSLRTMVEPLWKVIMSSKLFLVYMYKYFPECEYLLETYKLSDNKIGTKDVCIKPYYSREGENVTLTGNDGEQIEGTSGNYGEHLLIVQKKFCMPDFDGNHPVIGSWLIGGVPCGIGIRETKTLITDNMSMFVPHIIKD